MHAAIAVPHTRGADLLDAGFKAGLIAATRSVVVGGTSNPSYFFFQLKYVAWLIPAFRQMSATGIPSDPCFRMNAFWTSENLLAFIVFRSSQPMGNDAENSNSE